jgi:putative transposase
VRGLKQIPADAEIANAKLIRKPSGYYFHITTYSVPEEKAPTGALCGIDFGIKTNLTTSDGAMYDISVPESHAVKLASKKLNRSYKRNGNSKSNNHRRRQQKLRRAYERQNNQKADISNKVVHKLLDKYDLIAIQDELIAGWHHGLYGKQVQHSAMGSIKAKLKHSSKTIVVPASFPSTQKCPVCGKNTKHPTTKRVYDCSFCGYHHPSRDVKAAQSVLTEALEIASNNNVSPERRTKSPVETAPSDCSIAGLFVDGFALKVSSAKQEAQVL